MGEVSERDEETLNAFFDITFAMLPDYLIDEWLCGPLGFQDESSFQSLSQLAINQILGWEGPNVMQHDGLFVSDNSVVCVELKLKASTSPHQILKYACLIHEYERLVGRRRNIGIAFIVPHKKKGKIGDLGSGLID